MTRQRRALVVGGGIIGVTSAYALARDGWQVCLVESESQVGQGTSLGNGRQLSYSHVNALASPAILPQIPGLLLGFNDAFRMGFGLDPEFLGWLLQFLRNATSAAYRCNTLDTLALAEQSRKAMEELLSVHTIDFGRERSGKLVVLRSEAEISTARQSIDMKQTTGLRQQLLNREEACKLEPALQRSIEPIRGAIFSADDETGDCSEFTRSLADVSKNFYGLEILTARSAKAIKRGKSETLAVLENGEVLSADLVIAANGHCAPQLLAPLGHHVPIQPMKGYSFTAPIGEAPPRISVTDNKRRLVFTRVGSRMLIAGIAEIGRVDRSVDPKRLAMIKRAAEDSLPEAAIYSQADDGWAGLRPQTPHSQPITRILEPGIAINAGHGMLGWTLAMGSAERLGKLAAEA